MLTYCRPASSRSEKRYIKRFIDSVNGMQSDCFGNRYIVVGDSEPTTMFSSHTDTVHHKSGRQKILIDEFTGSVFSEGQNCLGADDTTGNFIMLTMMSNKIPGLYVFHRAEEIGGIGSDYFREHEIERWPTLKRCIAFDRKSTASVITDQMGDCCSDVFANALADQLHTKGNKWFADETGVFTDSANYVDIIPECTNLSVGYYNEHTSQEYQDYEFLQVFIKKLLKVEWSELPTARIAAPAVPWWNNYGGYEDEYDKEGNYIDTRESIDVPRHSTDNPKGLGQDKYGFYTNDAAYQELEDMCVYRPEDALVLLCDYYNVKKPERNYG